MNTATMFAKYAMFIHTNQYKKNTRPIQIRHPYSYCQLIKIDLPQMCQAYMQAGPESPINN